MIQVQDVIFQRIAAHALVDTRYVWTNLMLSRHVVLIASADELLLSWPTTISGARINLQWL